MCFSICRQGELTINEHVASQIKTMVPLFSFHFGMTIVLDDEACFICFIIQEYGFYEKHFNDGSL